MEETRDVDRDAARAELLAALDAEVQTEALLNIFFF